MSRPGIRACSTVLAAGVNHLPVYGNYRINDVVRAAGSVAGKRCSDVQLGSGFAEHLLSRLVGYSPRWPRRGRQMLLRTNVWAVALRHERLLSRTALGPGIHAPDREEQPGWRNFFSVL